MDAIQGDQQPEPSVLKAFGPDGELIAVSYDGGEVWHPAKGQEKQPSPPALRTFTRRIAAVMPTVGDVTFARRIIAPFSPLHEAGILTGWGPFAEVLNADLDAVVIPLGALMPEQIAEFRPGLVTFLDVPAPIALSDQERELMMACLQQVSAVLVASDQIAVRMRRFHPTVFAIPPVTMPDRWQGFTRSSPVGDPVRIAVQPSPDRGIQEALVFVRDRYGDKVEVVEDNWLYRHPDEEPMFYRDVDIVVVGPSSFPDQITAVNLLGPLMAGCCIVADRAYVRQIRDGSTGKIVAKSGPTAWRQALVTVIEDRRLRAHLQRGAHQQGRRLSARRLLAQLALPYRVLVPERPHFTVPPIGY